MIFSRSHELVLDGSKTQTRRVAYPQDELKVHELGTGWYGGTYIYNRQMKRVRFCAGRDYAVQPGRSMHGVGKITITDIRMEMLHDISVADAIAEGILPDGFEGEVTSLDYLHGFIQTWERLYKQSHKSHRWESNPKVIVLEFELSERYD